MNSLITFIRSCVNWERVHDFQLGIESYQVKVNLTAPTLTFPGIEAYEPYSIVDNPNTGLIYLNSKDEKRVKYLVEIVKFCDATLEKVLKEVKLKIFQSKPWKKSPLLGELDRDRMRAFEREITKCLSHREQMRRWESFVNHDDMEERTSMWVDKRLKKFNVYARYSVEHWKNMSYGLGHEHKFITKIIVRRANGKIDPITEPNYKYLNKNDIKDMYLLCINDKVKDYRETGLLGSLLVFIRAIVIWERVHDFQLGMESYQQKVNLTAPTITFPDIEEYKVFDITFERVCGMIYENSKKEKRVMVYKEILNFCDATLKRVLEKLEKYNKDVKHGYADPSPSNSDVEYLRFYEEDIRECLKHHGQMRHWEMYVNGRPLGSRRDRPE
ncbi:hypothetical protein Tco_0323374 [Tanacetum coccineum]